MINVMMLSLTVIVSCFVGSAALFGVLVYKTLAGTDITNDAPIFRTIDIMVSVGCVTTVMLVAYLIVAYGGQ